MDSLLSSAADFIARHHVWAGVVLGVVTFFESLVVIGAFVPATGLLVAAGGLVAAGVLDPVTVIAGCVIGAVMGDAISYWIGRRLGTGVLRQPMLLPHRRKIAWTRLYCRRYGVASIFIGRFFGPLRAFVPVMVGVLRMRQRVFQVANVVSAFVWVLAMLAPGYLAAKGLARLEFLSEAHGPTLMLIAFAGIVVAAVVAMRWLKGRAARRSALLEAAVK
ncbi:DedA family protein [Brevundimonas faecalis]|uniref:Membrane protein DedA with SNARE-associated domain n=1 Tax=Brevundimonas faecalis TaxID=947378 RepID=A0ABV2R8R9_9CAUL